jgi:hypothetical protein
MIDGNFLRTAYYTGSVGCELQTLDDGTATSTIFACELAFAATVDGTKGAFATGQMSGFCGGASGSAIAIPKLRADHHVALFTVESILTSVIIRVRGPLVDDQSGKGGFGR